MGDPQQVTQLLEQTRWNRERKKLRALLLEGGLREDVKWGKLCYSFEGGKVAIIYGLKNYCAIGFFKGSLLEDRDQALVQPGKHSQAMRQLRFASLKEIVGAKDLIARFIQKAIQAEKDGLEVEFVEKDNLVYPDELHAALRTDPTLSKAFETLTPGRQRGYVLHFSGAKKSETRTSRIEKCRARILQGKGHNER